MGHYKCPTCGEIQSESYAVCPACGSRLDDRRQRSSGAEKQGPLPRWREWLFLTLLAVMTFIVYNLIAGAGSEKPGLEPRKPAAGDSFQAAVNLGNAFMDRGMWTHAIEQYEKALQLDSLNPDVIVDLGACYHAIGEPHEAVHQFDRALAQAPEHPIALFNMGIAHLSLADTAATRSWWLKFIEVAGDRPEAEIVKSRLEEL